MNEGRNLSVAISSGTILRIILFVLGVALLFYLKDLLLIILTAVVIASSVEPAVRWFGKQRVPRPAAVMITYLLIAIFFVAFFYFFVPPLLDEVNTFLGDLPEKFIDLGLLDSSSLFLSSGFADISKIFTLQDFFTEFKTALSGVSGGFIKAASLVFGGALSFILILVLSFYFAVQDTGIDDFLRVITPLKHQEYLVGLWRRAQFKIGLWMQGQILLGVLMGVLVYLGLTILGVSHPLMLATIVALFELVPIFGPILAAVPAIIIAFGDGGTSLGLMTVALYVILQQFESHLIYPLVVRKVVGIPPLLVIIALIAGAKMAGFLGVILSIPLSAAIREYLSDLQSSRVKGGDVPTP